MDEPLTVTLASECVRRVDMVFALAGGVRPKRVVRSLVMFLIFPSLMFGLLVNQWLHFSFPKNPHRRINKVAPLGDPVLLHFGAWLARYLVKAQRRRGDPQRILITDNGVERVLTDATVASSWTSILRVEETPRMFHPLWNFRSSATSIEKFRYLVGDRTDQGSRTFASTQARPISRCGERHLNPAVNRTRRLCLLLGKRPHGAPVTLDVSWLYRESCFHPQRERKVL
jgi:hypothetical protein